MIAHTCDAAGCGSTEPTTNIGGLDLCARCLRAVNAHLKAWLADTAAQSTARSDQATADAAAEAHRLELEKAAAAALLEAQVQHVAKRKGFDPQLLRDKLAKEGGTLHDAIRDVLLDLNAAKLQADRIAAARANAEHKKTAKAELEAHDAAVKLQRVRALDLGLPDPTPNPVVRSMLEERAAGAEAPEVAPTKPAPQGR